MTKYVGAIDQGTTSTRFMIFDHAAGMVGTLLRPTSQGFYGLRVLRGQILQHLVDAPKRVVVHSAESFDHDGLGERVDFVHAHLAGMIQCPPVQVR